MCGGRRTHQEGPRSTHGVQEEGFWVGRRHLRPARQHQAPRGRSLVKGRAVHGLAVATAVKGPPAEVPVDGQAAAVGDGVQGEVRERVPRGRGAVPGAVAHGVARGVPDARREELGAHEGPTVVHGPRHPERGRLGARQERGPVGCLPGARIHGVPRVRPLLQVQVALPQAGEHADAAAQPQARPEGHVQAPHAHVHAGLALPDVAF